MFHLRSCFPCKVEPWAFSLSDVGPFFSPLAVHCSSNLVFPQPFTFLLHIELSPLIHSLPSEWGLHHLYLWLCLPDGVERTWSSRPGSVRILLCGSGTGRVKWGVTCLRGSWVTWNHSCVFSIAGICRSVCLFPTLSVSPSVWSVMSSSVVQLCLTFCDSMDCSTPGLPVHHQLPELAQTGVHRVGDAIQPSHPLSSPSPAFNLSQHQGLF